MKNKSMIKYFAIVFTLVFCFASLTATATSNEAVTFSVFTDKSNEFYTTQYESIQIYNDLLDSFNTRRTISNAPATIWQEYPDYYGGAYIDTDTGKLVVMVTSESFTKTLQSTYNIKSSAVNYELCDIPYNQLKTLYDELNDKLEYFSEKDIRITSISINDKEQTVSIDVFGLTPKKESAIRKVFSNTFLDIHSVNSFTKTSSIGPGSPATDYLGRTSTVGFAATRYGVDGFIIAGHAGYIGDTFTSGSQILGEITESSFYNHSTADAAFVEAASGTNPTHVIPILGRLVSTTTDRLPQNTVVYKYGRATHNTIGYIINAIHTFYYEIDGYDYYFEDCVKASYNAAVGDSGGPVCIYTGSSGAYVLCGIQSGIGSNHSVYTPYSNIVDELDVSCVTGS